MVFITPPPSNRKPNMFSKSPNKPVYYEDLYGKLNSDEEFDRFPDDCDEESSSGGDDDKDEKEDKANEGFFARFRTPKRKHALGGQRSRNLGENKRRKAHGIFNFINHSPPSSTPNEKGYRISPSHNRRHSVAIHDRKKLTPRKGGLFASSLANMDFGVSTPNSAGEMMEDMFRAGAESGMEFEGHLDVPHADDAFMREVQDAAYGSPQIDPALLEGGARNESGDASGEVEVSGGVSGGGEGHVEDNTEEEIAFEKAGRGGGRRKAGSTSLGSTHQTSKPLAATANTKSKLQKSAPTPPARPSTRIAKTQPTTRPGAKAASKGKSARLQAKGLGTTSARAASLREKPETTNAVKKKKMRAKQLGGEVGGRSVRLRNWKGEVVGQAKGAAIVVVVRGEVDPEEYERC